jgi:high-affinity Fe2+/Pb2+ permease
MNMPEWEDSNKAPLTPPHAEDPVLRQFMREGREARLANSQTLMQMGARLSKIEAKQSDIDDGQAHMIKLLERNTEITEEIRDIRTAGKVITRIVLWFGGVAGAVAAVVGLYFSTWGKK